MATLGTYTATRPRGLAAYRPQAKARVLIGEVHQVLAEYSSYLPMTLRQVFYRLVGKYDYPKTENAYDSLGEVLNRARRGGLIPFSAIRDDGPVVRAPSAFDGQGDFWDMIERAAGAYRRDRLEGQPTTVELWCEAGGMVPQLARVAHEFGVTVFSSGGFDSVTAKYEAAERIADREVPTLVLHVGDLDPSGHAVFDSASEDVSAFVSDLGSWAWVEFRRVAVSSAQVDRYELPSAPPKRTDRRGGFTGETVQAEALDPATLASEVEEAIKDAVDEPTLRLLVAEETRERELLIAKLAEVRC